METRLIAWPILLKNLISGEAEKILAVMGSDALLPLRGYMQRMHFSCGTFWAI